MDVGYVTEADWLKRGPTPPTIPQPEYGTDPNKVSEKVLVCGHMPQIRGCSRENWGLLGEANKDTTISTKGLIDTEAVLPTHIRAAATYLPYRFGEGVRRLHNPILAERSIPPWPARTNSRHPFQN